MKSLYFKSGSKCLEPGEKDSGLYYYKFFLLLNDRISSHFNDICLKLPTDAYFIVLSLTSCVQNMKIVKKIFIISSPFNSIIV